MFSLLVCTAAGLLLYYVGDKIYKHFTFFSRQGIPSHHFVTFDWASKPFTQWVDENTKLYGKVYGFFIGTNTKALVINDAKLARDLSTKDLHKFVIRNSGFYQGTTNITKSLFFLDATENWKRIRSIVTPAFTSGKLRRMISPIERIANNFVEHMRPHAKLGDEFDLKKYIGGFAMDVIACCGYGIDLDSVNNPNHPVVTNAKKILNVDTNLTQFICFMLPKVGEFFKLEMFDYEAVKYFDNLTFEIVEKRLKQQNGVKQNPDLLGLMIEECQNDKQTNGIHHKGISRDEMSGQGILFFIAGFDTTHATFDHVIYYLSKYPEWQEKLFQELDPIREELDYDKFKSLPILNAIISETLRLNPPLTIISREASEDCEILDTGIKVEKHTLISIQPYAIHRNPEYFPDPNTFKPERFLVDKTESAEAHFAYMPFGVGPRLCVGMRFAQNELRIGLANFVLNYKVTIDPAFKLEYFKGAILMSPKSLMVRISERL